MSKKVWKRAMFVFKALIAAGLLVWVLSQVHWHDYVQDKDGKEYSVLEEYPPIEQLRPIDDSGAVIRMGFASTMRRIRPILAGCAFLGFPLSLLIIGCRWWLLLRLQRIFIRLWEAVRLTFLGQFFNAVVPGIVGGDLVKAYYVSKHTPRKAVALLSVVVDRVMGLTELTLLAAVMIAVVWVGGLADYDEIRLPLITVSIVTVVVAVILVFLLSRTFRRALHLQKLYQRLWVARHIEAMGEAAVLYRRHIGSLFQVILITLGAHIIWVGSIALIGLSLSIPVPWYSYFLYIPLIYIIGAVPLTPGGIGLVEQFYLVFFPANPSEVLALALLARLVPMFWGLPGAVVAVTGPKLPKVEALQAELGLDPNTPD
jgi:uncharacterized protein (TIRG00374 family)